MVRSVVNCILPQESVIGIKKIKEMITYETSLSSLNKKTPCHYLKQSVTESIENMSIDVKG